MKIGIRGGHVPGSGASHYIEEYTNCKLIADKVENILGIFGHCVIRCNSGIADSGKDLEIGVEYANSEECDLFISIHMNSTNNPDIASGCEAWVFPNSSAHFIAREMCGNIGVLGFNNRGVKTSEDYYELRKTDMPAIILEVLFVNSVDDVKLYEKVGVDTISHAIAYAVRSI